MSSKGKHWKLSSETRARMSKAQKGLPHPGISDEKHPNWKGDATSYRSLHRWVVRKLGKPPRCTQCFKIPSNPKAMHWANKSHKYLRDITDWIRLCASCHGKYDSSLKKASQ